MSTTTTSETYERTVVLDVLSLLPSRNQTISLEFYVMDLTTDELSLGYPTLSSLHLNSLMDDQFTDDADMDDLCDVESVN